MVLGMTHRPKKRTRTDLEANGVQSSRVLGNMRSSKEAPGYQSSPNSMDAPPPYHQRQTSIKSSGGEFRNSISRPSNASGLPSPVLTITPTPSYETCERRNSTLIEIIHPSHEPAPQLFHVADQPEYENYEINTAVTKQMILGACEALHISSGIYNYL
jgi:hypothetical protein